VVADGEGAAEVEPSEHAARAKALTMARAARDVLVVFMVCLQMLTRLSTG
jgi:hypothetical protein